MGAIFALQPWLNMGSKFGGPTRYGGRFSCIAVQGRGVCTIFAATPGFAQARRRASVETQGCPRVSRFSLAFPRSWQPKQVFSVFAISFCGTPRLLPPPGQLHPWRGWAGGSLPRSWSLPGAGARFWQPDGFQSFFRSRFVEPPRSRQPGSFPAFF